MISLATILDAAAELDGVPETKIPIRLCFPDGNLVDIAFDRAIVRDGEIVILARNLTGLTDRDDEEEE